MMGGKFLEKRVTLDLSQEPKKPGSLELEYYLLESKIAESETEEFRNAYGVEIVKKYREQTVEKKHYKDIYFTKEKARSFIELLAKNTVTPITLPYIIDDMLGA